MSTKAAPGRHPGTAGPVAAGADGMDVVLAAGGEAGRLMRSVDWSATPLGPISAWPQSLRSAVSICLLSRFPIVLFWGPELCLIYNDGYIPMLGQKAEWAMGAPGRVVWREIWSIVGPMLEGVMYRRESTWSDDQLLLLERHGYPEECYFTFSYSPIDDESGAVGGVFCAVTETSDRVIGERRLRTLGELAAHVARTESAVVACLNAAEALAQNPADIPYSIIYLIEEGAAPTAVASTGDLTGVDTAEWPVAEVAVTGMPWRRPPGVLALPIPTPGGGTAAGVLVAGVNPRRALDADYERFFELIARQVGSAVADARAYQTERRHAEALAELDRAKTAFFSNVSHEFRTPLTLLLGPLEQALTRLPVGERADFEVAHRNALRMLKLVNTLLDFSRIEAGRVEIAYEAVDFSGITADLASSFRSAIEAGGLELVVDCPGLGEEAYLDRDMWEKVVLNLLSNAFKFTFEGRISVTTRVVGADFVMTVADTGVGVPAAELPRLFDRFYRVRGSKARTYEGTGIGLSLVNELVRFHGGEIRVDSAPGQGTTFTVAIPRGSAHLPADRIGRGRSLGATATATGSAPFIEEALSWLPADAAGTAAAAAERDGTSTAGAPAPRSESRVLVVDDNPDMRRYLVALLAEHWRIDVAGDGQEALEMALHSPPDIVLTDVMMPRMDGFQLLRALRGDQRTRHIPIVMLSARAGEEATVEGLDAGADDYLVKPFVARELIARVRANLDLASARLVAKSAVERYDEAEVILQRATAALAAVAQHIRAGVDLPTLLGRLSETVTELVGARRVIFWGLRDGELEPLSAAAAFEPPAPVSKLRVKVRPDGDGLADRVLFRGEIANWRIGDERLAPYHDVLSSLDATTGLSVPWRAGDEPLGILAVYNSTKPGGFTDDDAWVLRIAALAAALVWEHKKVEDALAQMSRHEADRLRAQLDQSASLEREKSQFLNLASHELRGPLAVINGYVSLIKNGLLGDISGDVASALPIVDRKVQEIRVLVDQMLETSRLEDTRVALERTRHDLGDVVRRSVETIAPLVPRSHRLSVSLPHVPVPIDGDGARLGSVITNLIDNAVRYSPAGGVVEIRCAVRRRAGQALVEVKDEGLGIAAHDMPRLFTKFGRILTRENSHISGTGLGLYLSNEIVRMHGGEITVRSAPRRGSRFTVVLPLAAGVPTKPPPASAPASDPAQARR